MSTTELQTVLPQPVEQDTGPGIAEYLGIFRRRIKLIVIPFFLSFVLSAVVAYVIPAEFTQSTKFKISDPGLTRKLTSGVTGGITHKPLLRTMSSDIKNRRFLGPIVAKVGLNEGFNLNDPLEETDFYAYVFKSLKITVPNQRERLAPGPDLVTFTYTGRSQARNVEFLNEIRDSYKEHFRRQYRRTIRGIYDQQRAAVRDARDALALMEAGYEDFRNSEDYRLVGIKKDHLKQMADLRDRENTLRFKINGIQSQLQAIKMQLRDQNQTSSVLNQVANPQRAILKAAIANEQQILNDWVNVKGWTDLIPAVVAQKEKIAQMQEQYLALPVNINGGSVLQINQVYTQLQVDRNNLQRELNGARDILGQVTRRIETLQGELSKEIDLTRADAKFLADIAKLKHKEAIISGKFDKVQGEWRNIQGEGSDLFETLDLPNPNTKPVFPSIPLFLAIGAGFGLILGLGLAFLKEFSSQTYLTPNQVQSRLTVPILGEVSEIKTQEELDAEQTRKRRNYVVGGVIVAIIAFVHYCYFEASMSHLLPPIVIDVFDMLYKGS